MLDSVILDTLKCVFFILFVISMAGGFVYFMDTIRECGMREELENLKDRVLMLEHQMSNNDGDDDGDDDDDEDLEDDGK